MASNALSESVIPVCVTASRGENVSRINFTPKVVLLVSFPIISEFIKLPIRTKIAPLATGITTRSNVHKIDLCTTFLL